MPHSQSDNKRHPPRQTYQNSRGSPGIQRDTSIKIQLIKVRNFGLYSGCTLRVSLLLTILGSTVISQEQLVPGSYFLSGQLGVLISPWAFVILPPQNCSSETSRKHSIRVLNEETCKFFLKLSAPLISNKTFHIYNKDINFNILSCY